MSRCFVILTFFVFLCACSPKDASRLEIPPGDAGTFVAIGAETELDISEPAKGSEEAFKFQVKAVPNKGISIGRAVGQAQADSNEDKYFVPASITKVVTASVALKLLGDQFHFTTKVSWQPLEEGRTAHNLTITADGDPIVGKDRLRSIAETLKKRGIQRLTGYLNMVSSDPRKDFSYPPFGMDAEDYLNCYGSRVQAFNLQRNCSSLQISGWNQAQWMDASVRIPVVFSPSERNLTNFSISRTFGEPGGFLTGYAINFIPQGKKYGLGLPVSDVKSWYGRVLLVELRNAGFDTSTLNLVSNMNDVAGSESFEIESVPLSGMVRMMNKVSDNFLAEALFKGAAGFDPDPNIQTAAMNTVKKNIAEWMALNQTPDLGAELKLYDGAGLSRANQVTPRAFLALLRSFTKEAFFPKLWASLPIAGVDGTLRGRMGGSLAGGTVRAKTGTLKGCYQLAGYIPRLNDAGAITEYIPFVILSATTANQSSGARGFQDRVLGELAAQINKGRTAKRNEAEATLQMPRKAGAKKRHRK